jgi:hypothetical protein
MDEMVVGDGYPHPNWESSNIEIARVHMQEMKYASIISYVLGFVSGGIVASFIIGVLF